MPAAQASISGQSRKSPYEPPISRRTTRLRNGKCSSAGPPEQAGVAGHEVGEGSDRLGTLPHREPPHRSGRWRRACRR